MTLAGWWLALALVLGIAELLVPGVFLVFVAAAAAITGAIVLALPQVPLAAQLGAFAVWSIVTVAIGRRWYADHPVSSANPRLNDPAARLIGQSVTVEADFVHGRGRVRIGDGAWLARGPDLLAGDEARVTSVEGGVLMVEPL
jgi:membrane protein implicated in regulation of membrane protease activity